MQDLAQKCQARQNINVRACVHAVSLSRLAIFVVHCKVSPPMSQYFMTVAAVPERFTLT